MDGKTLLYDLRHLLKEDSDSGFLDSFTSYRWLNDAAGDFQLKTGALKATQSITTVADQASYYVNGDYLGLHLQNSSFEYILKLVDDSDVVYWVKWKPYEEVIIENQTASVTIPTHFTIYDYGAAETQVTGTATSDGDATAGKCTLTDTSGVFTTTEYVSPHDTVHNTTDGSMGVLISVTSATALVCALFGGTGNNWDTDDTYVIQPQNRYKIQFSPPPSTADYTATLYYLQRPAPVYSDYDAFRFPNLYSSALVKYAAWLYKYRDDEPDKGDKLYMHYLSQVAKFNHSVDHIHRRKHIRVNLRRRSG